MNRDDWWYRYPMSSVCSVADIGQGWGWVNIRRQDVPEDGYSNWKRTTADSSYSRHSGTCLETNMGKSVVLIALLFLGLLFHLFHIFHVVKHLATHALYNISMMTTYGPRCEGKHTSYIQNVLRLGIILFIRNKLFIHSCQGFFI